MTASQQDSLASLKQLNVDVVERRVKPRKNWVACEIETNLAFDTQTLETYLLADWSPLVFDALLVAAAVEFCDKICRRSTLMWGRSFVVRIPVHDPLHWNQSNVRDSLKEALSFLTGDIWEIEFYVRNQPALVQRTGLLGFSNVVTAVIPYSDGLDSLAVAELTEKKLGSGLVRVRLSSRQQTGNTLNKRLPFASIPYDVKATTLPFRESSGRSRGFKFSLIAGLAAFLANTDRVIIPESGQGAMGASIVPIGQMPPDYRSHPLFMDRMSRFLFALLGHKVHFEFPQLWYTKGETLSQFIAESNLGPTWTLTRSCWQGSRQVGVAGKKRQCGVCAACLLRRLSVHAAGCIESSSTYVWENLSASTFEDGVSVAFDNRNITRAMKEYAISGALHLDHLSRIQHSRDGQQQLSRMAFELAPVLNLSITDIQRQFSGLLTRHEQEWSEFIKHLGRNSFLARLVTS